MADPSSTPTPDPWADVPRYDLMTNYRAGSSIEEMERADDGEWVRWEAIETVKSAVEAQHASEFEQLKETNGRLNRRCQLAEAALNTRQEDWNKRSTKAIRNHYYARWRESEQRAEAAELRLLAANVDLGRAEAEIVRLQDLVCVQCGGIGHMPWDEDETCPRCNHRQRAEAAEAEIAALRAQLPSS